MEVNILEELFLSTEVFGYLGPLILVVGGAYLVARDKKLWIIFVLVDSLFIYTYFTLIQTNGVYIWHSLIMLFGMLFTLIYPIWDR